jgi:uncharacterized phage protein gp47/JayE
VADLLSLIPVREETLDKIIARIDADLNAGLAPDDPEFVDTTPGTFYSDIRMALALEIERLWDVATSDTVAASLVEYAWGVYLDAHGETLNLPRNDEVAATGEVTFSGTNTTIISVGTEVSTTQATADEEPISFLTTEGGVISGGSVTLPVEAAEPGSSGNVVGGAINLLLSPVSGVSSITNTEATTGGTNVESDEDYRDRIKLSWSAAQGSGSIADYVRWCLAIPPVGNVRVTPIWNGPGTVRVTITDTDNNPVSPAVIAEVQDALDPYQADTLLNGIQSGTPATVTVDDTTNFQISGQVYVGDTLIQYTGKTATTFTGCTYPAGSLPGANDNALVAQHGSGVGLAPVGAIVSVRTADTVVVNVAAELVLADGYTVDGAVGTIAVGPEITSLITNFINSLPPGAEAAPGIDDGSGDILLLRLTSLIGSVPGVYSITTLTIDAVAADFAVAADEVPETGTVTVTTA